MHPSGLLRPQNITKVSCCGKDAVRWWFLSLDRTTAPEMRRASRMHQSFQEEDQRSYEQSPQHLHDRSQAPYGRSGLDRHCRLVGIGAVTTGTVPVLAEAVRVEAPQAPGFADVVEHVSPAVVSVRVKYKIQPASDGGADMPAAARLRRPSRRSSDEAVLPRVPWLRRPDARRRRSNAAAATAGRGRSRRAPASSSPRTAISSPTTTSSTAARPSPS